MPKSDDRFYLMEMSNRPAMYGDIGSLLRIEGLVIGGGGTKAVLMLPGYSVKGSIGYSNGHDGGQIIDMTVEDWSDWLQRSDNPEILVGPSVNGQSATLPKIFHRKLRYEISGAVQQKVWAADAFMCRYCGAPMGKALMTIDHFVPLELGGLNDVTNYLSSCKACNKAKGSQAPEVFCAARNIDFGNIEEYLKQRKIS